MITQIFKKTRQPMASFNMYFRTKISKLGRIIAFKQIKNFVYVAEVRPMLLYTSHPTQGMYNNPILSIRKDVVNKEVIMATFNGRGMHDELECQYASDSPYLIFSIDYMLAGAPAGWPALRENECIMIDGSSESEDQIIPSIIFNNRQRSTIDSKIVEIYDEDNDSCNFIAYLKHTLFRPQETVPSVEITEPVQHEEPVQPAKVIDKESKRYKMLYSMFNGNEELIEKMY